ncbi:hypothetical protein [Actinomadura montaniterrae]|uniref:hypothetical protein n=1 Tax=Actinomadura montaniterrae TaxID=1803903 RepID=UPI001CEF926E|nr:hypothetical protein [Actinomadura montaniterrae]
MIVRDWGRRHLVPENIAHTWLVHEIEGLAAAGRLGGRVPAFLAARAELVACGVEPG